jgi:hypothetical protein
MSDDLAGRYPELAQLLGAYLNQDYDLRGPALEDAVLAFLDDAAPDHVVATRADIARFLADNAADVDGALDALDPDHAQEPDMSARDYLLWLDRLLAETSAAAPARDHAAE